MRFAFRRTRRDDFSACLRIIGDRALYDDAASLELLAMWKYIYVRQIGESSVVFDRDTPNTLLAFGLSVFIEPEYADTLARNPEPFIARRLLRLWLAGSAPFLNERTMARANASIGVDVLVLHQGFAAGYGPEAMSGLRLQLGQSFTGAHAGLRFRSFTHELYPEGPVTESEVFGYPSPRAAAAAGFLIRPYASSASTGAIANLPFVIGMTREEARERPGNLITDIMFAWDGRPHFGLDSASRRVLKLAIEGETDEAIARELDVSVAAVKKRWRSIYEHIEDIEPNVFRSLDSRADGHRGAELRRNVLRVVRNHPEELYPYEADAAAGRRERKGGSTSLQSRSALRHDRGRGA